MKSLVLLAIPALAAPARAEQIDAPSIQSSATYSLDIGSHVRWLGDPSGAILTADPLGGARITLGRSVTALDVPGRRDVELGVFARGLVASATGELFGSLETSLLQHGLAGGARLDAPIVWRIRGVAQAELGYLRTALTVTQGAMTPVEDHHWAPYAAASLGADLALLERPRFRLGLAVDLGYTVTVPVELHALPGERPDEELSIETDYAAIGKLDTRGVTYAVALRGAF